MAIDCCHGCVPPKRTPTCKFDGTCNRYAEAKERHDAERAVLNQKRDIEYGLIGQAVKGIDKARKIRRNRKGV